MGGITAQPDLANAPRVEQARTPQPPASVFSNASVPADIAERAPSPSYPFVASVGTDHATILEVEAEEDKEKELADVADSICAHDADVVTHGEEGEAEQKGTNEQKDEDEYDDDLYL